MFKGKANHTVLGIEAPWLYMRVFFFMLICTAISLVFSFVRSSILPFIVVGGLCAVVPLMVFLFETNYARNLTILDVGKMFLIGGLSSLVLTMIFYSPFAYAGEVVSAVLLAPLLEELAKAIIVIFFVAKIKPKNMLTGLLIGFSIGAGFALFENFVYAFDAYSEFLILENNLYDANIMSMIVLIVRTFWNFFSGHHYYTAIFGAIYVLFKKEVTFKFKDLCQWKVLCGYIIPVLLHMIWNASTYIEASFVALLIEALICVACVLSLTFLINIGINQTRVMEIYENYQVPSQAEETIYTTVE
jgi:RsiW-degrading membrane proteinase PrsW (M82 family)